MRHRALEIDIDCASVRTCVRSQVHRPASELAMHPIRDKRGEWGQQSARYGHDFVQRRESGSIVLSLDIVEAVPALAYVPFRDILVEKRHHRLGGVGRLVAAEQVVGLTLDARESRQY